MPRTYVRKKIKAYTPQDLAHAIEKVRNGELTQYGAAQEYNIPMTTLHEHVNKEFTRPNAGRPTVIQLEEEKKLAETIKIMEKWGFGLSRIEIMELVAEYLRINKIPTPFKSNCPGPDWFINFRKRHGLSIKKAQPVEFVRRKMTDPFVIDEYFNLLDNTLKDLDLFESPQFIWNLDETSLCLDPSRTKVVGQKNKPCSRTTHGSGKENITVLAGASATGKKLPPLIVFKGKFIWNEWMADLDDGDYDFELSYAASTKGWMETDIFYNYLEKILIPNLGEKRPVLIIYDGHSTHVDVRVVELAIQNRITILKLPPHTSHLLQPLDISVFKSFKTTWDAKLVDWQRRNIGTKMPKKVFAQTMADTWQRTNTDVIRSGFKKAGIYPFNKHVIPVEKYDPDAYKRYQKKMSEAHLTNNFKSPKLLKEICIDFFNNQLPKTNDAHEKSNTDNVALLSQVSKSDIQTLRFVANQPTALPICLRLQNDNPIQSQTPKPKINVTSNLIIKKPQIQAQPLPQQSCTFEELLLRKIQQDKKDTTTTKKKRVTKGAEVITAAMGKKILEEKEKSKYKKVISKTSKSGKQTKKNKKDNSAIPIVTAQKQEQPGPSGIKNKNKRKRQPSLDSITSISDIMSEHSDSDIIDYADLEELIDEYSEDNFEIHKKGPTPQKIIKDLNNDKKNEKKLSGGKILTDKDSNLLYTKCKGVDKKSKGKENQADKKYTGKKMPLEIDGENDVDVSVRGKNMKTTEDKDEHPLLELENKYEIHEEDPVIMESYKLNDSVLVRYLIRKKWRYYIGFIDEIINQHTEETYFSISFLKTVRLQQQLTFITTKRKDTDKIPESLIVKKIDIQKENDNEKEYFLTNNEDTVYFD